MPNVTCPFCGKATWFEQKENPNSAVKCEHCGEVFFKREENKNDAVEPSIRDHVLTRVIKCPHCSEYLILDFCFQVDLDHIMKKKAIKCPECKGKRSKKDGSPCNTCTGLGVIKKDDQP